MNGRVLIFVWALEQTGKRDFDKDVQDVFVPWAMPKKVEPKVKDRTNSRPQGVKKKDKKKQQNQELKEEQKEDGTVDAVAQTLEQVSLENKEKEEGEEKQKQERGASSVTPAGATKTIDAKPIEEQESSLSSSSEQQQQQQTTATAPEIAAPVYNRYYHLFQKGELEDLVLKTNKATIVQQGYDRDNWWCILEKTSN